MKKVLLTGASGHLGGRALQFLRSRCEIHAIVRVLPSAPLEHVHYHKLDLSQPWSWEALPERMDAVIHLAQPRNYANFPSSALEIFSINVATTALLLEYARRSGVSHFVLASTGGLYRPGLGVIDENAPLDPPRGNLFHYFQTKYSAELLVQSYASLMSVTILRPFFIYGPGQAPEKLIARLIDAVRRGKPIQIAGGDGVKLNPVYVDDVADFLAVLIEREGLGVVNVAGPDAVSIRDMASRIGRLLDLAPVIEESDGRVDDIVAETRVFARALGRHLTQLDDGLRATLQKSSCVG